MNAELSLQEALQIEDTVDLLDFTCPSSGLLLWPLIRLPMLRFLLSDLCYGEPLVGTPPAYSRGKAISSLMRAARLNWQQRGVSSPIFLMGTGLGDYQRDGRWFNRLTDYFAAQSGSAYVMQDFWGWRWPFPRDNNKLLLHAPYQVAAVMAGKILVRDHHRRLAASLIALVSERAERFLSWRLGQDRRTFLIQMLARHMAAIPIRQAFYERLLSRLGVKLLLKEEACYGPSAILMDKAREMGIVTAEYQHGVVSAGADAYNFAPALAGSASLQRTLPDYFLAYGKWWTDQINAPVKKVVIGNPHRTERLAGMPQSSAIRTDILILGDGFETRLYLELCESIARSAQGAYRVVYRPHPMERERAVEMSKGLGAAVILDGNGDIYQSFGSAQAIVSEVSTGLFEAVGLVPNIFIWDTPKARFCFPNFPFATVADGTDILERLATGRDHGGADADIWENHWQQNYRVFLERTVGLTSTAFSGM